MLDDTEFPVDGSSLHSLKTLVPIGCEVLLPQGAELRSRQRGSQEGVKNTGLDIAPALPRHDRIPVADKQFAQRKPLKHGAIRW